MLAAKQKNFKTPKKKASQKLDQLLGMNWQDVKSNDKTKKKKKRSFISCRSLYHRSVSPAFTWKFVYNQNDEAQKRNHSQLIISNRLVFSGFTDLHHFNPIKTLNN